MSRLIYLADSLDATVDRLLADEELTGGALTHDKVRRSLESFGGDEIACSVFLKKYAVRDQSDRITELTLNEAKNRWACEMGAAEEKFSHPRQTSHFRELYEHFLPAGRQMFALGNRHIKLATYTNCYVTETNDSLESIFDAAYKIAKTYSYGGGQGLCIGKLRPAKARVSNSARFSTGAVSFMSLYSLVTGLIGQHGRRGALMLTIPVDHPDIEDFLSIKHNNTDQIKYANISVKLTDEFMRAVTDDLPFTLRFTTKHETMERNVNARALWGKIIQVARDSAEPGLMFWDRMVEMSPSDTYDRLKVSCTNPCGEQVLSPGDACVLGSLLLHRFVKNPFTARAAFDFDLFRDMTARAVRHLDNVVELNLERHPLPEQQEAARLGRRIGLGMTGLGDMFAALSIRYDSDEAIEFAEKIADIKKVTEYSASMSLAKERGAFPLFDPEKHYERGFCATLPEELKAEGREHGQRNVAISTIAPSGSLSIMAQCSSGIEPIFALNYKRYCELGNDRKEFTVNHPGWARCSEMLGGDAPCPDTWVVAHEIDYRFRVTLQGVLQRHIDASISSTINLPRDVSAETVGEIYLAAWAEGLKGVTVYREGSREGILVSDEFAQRAGDPHLDTIIHRVRAEGGDKFYIPVSYTDGDIRKPYQVFAMNYKATENDRFSTLARALVRMLKENGVCEGRIDKYLQRSTSALARVTRFISLSLSTGYFDECYKIIEDHAYAGTLAAEFHKIFTKSLAVKRALCAKCSGSNVRMEEGCMHCLDCGWSGCN